MWSIHIKWRFSHYFWMFFFSSRIRNDLIDGPICSVRIFFVCLFCSSFTNLALKLSEGLLCWINKNSWKTSIECVNTAVQLCGSSIYIFKNKTAIFFSSTFYTFSITYVQWEELRVILHIFVSAFQRWANEDKQNLNKYDLQTHNKGGTMEMKMILYRFVRTKEKLIWNLEKKTINIETT